MPHLFLSSLKLLILDSRDEYHNNNNEGATALDRSGTATSSGLAGDGQRAVTTLLWIDGSPGRGDPRGYTVTGTVRPPPRDSRGRVGREVRIVDEIKLLDRARSGEERE